MSDSIIENISYKIYTRVENSNNIDFDSFLHDVISYMINEMNLQDYVSDVMILDFYDKNPSSKGCYNRDNNICIFKSGVEKSVDEMLQKAPYLSDLEIDLCKTILYIKTAVHELQHAKQSKMLVEDPQNNFFETIITRLSQTKEGINNIGYFCSYDIYPTERLAEVTANRFIVKVLDILEKITNIEKLSCIMRKKVAMGEFYQYYQCGLSGPTTYYFNFFNKESYSVLKKKIESSNITLDDRVLYGFEITRKEYEELVAKYGYFYEQAKSFSDEKSK